MFKLEIDNLKSLEEVSNYHNSDNYGFFSILTRTPTNTKQISYPLNKLDLALTKINPEFDNWISQNEFSKPNRRLVNLLRLNLLYVDIDTYKMDWAQGKSPEALADAVKYFCQQELIPEPSLLVYSGRGIQSKWLLDVSLPRQALPRWNACQKHLITKLAELGADSAAKDASRVLRVVNTVNSKSGDTCRVIHVLEENNAPKRYNFEYLCEVLLPVARWDIEEQKQRKQSKLIDVANSFDLDLNKLKKPKTNLKAFNRNQLAWDRLEDLRKLREIRGGVVPEGERMLHLFWSINFLLLSKITNSKSMYHEAAALAKEIDPNWSYRSEELITLYNKAKEHEAGKKITFNNKEYPALYTPRNSTLISLFKITIEEQQQLRTIINKETAQERKRKRDKTYIKTKRRQQGVISREQYLKDTENKRIQVISLREQGLSLREIAKKLKLSLTSVSSVTSC